MIRRPPRSTLFPTRRSSDLRVRDVAPLRPGQRAEEGVARAGAVRRRHARGEPVRPPDVLREETSDALQERDRKSTRLNSSHPSISYAVFCLKKKTNNRQPAT